MTMIFTNDVENLDNVVLSLPNPPAAELGWRAMSGTPPKGPQQQHLNERYCCENLHIARAQRHFTSTQLNKSILILQQSQLYQLSALPGTEKHKMALAPSSPRLPSPPPPTEIQIGPQSPSSGSGSQENAIEQSILQANAARRIHPGTKAADMAAGPPLIPLGDVSISPTTWNHSIANKE